MTHLEKLDYIPQNIDLMAGMDITGNIKHLFIMFPGNMFNNGTSHTIHNEKRDIAYFAAGPLFSDIGAK